MCVTRGNMGWNTRVSSSGKGKDQRYLCMGVFFKICFYYSLVDCKEKQKECQALFSIKSFSKMVSFRKTLNK